MTTHNALEFDLGRLDQFMRTEMSGLTGKVWLERIGAGQSNPIFFLTYGDRRLVLRKKTPGTVLPSAHAVDREYRVLRALAGGALPVPPVLHFHAGTEVVGTPFYVMERVEGRIFSDNSLPDMSRSQRREIYLEMSAQMAVLRRLDWAALGLADFGQQWAFPRLCRTRPSTSCSHGLAKTCRPTTSPRSRTATSSWVT